MSDWHWPCNTRLVCPWNPCTVAIGAVALSFQSVYALDRTEKRRNFDEKDLRKNEEPKMLNKIQVLPKQSDARHFWTLWLITVSLYSFSKIAAVFWRSCSCFFKRACQYWSFLRSSSSFWRRISNAEMVAPPENWHINVLFNEDQV